MSDLIEILNGRKKFGELTYEQLRSYEHAEKVVADKAKYAKAKHALEALGILEERTVIKLSELMPKNVMLVKQILVQEGKTFSEDQVAKIFSITSGK